jgi:hypothetical protein
VPSFVPAKRATAYTFYVGLVSQADTKLLQANPTLAAGDVKIAIDDGAPANLGTLPVVDADFTKRVKVVLSAAEMTGDNISLIFSDAAGAEWCDLIVNLQTAARQLDDLAFPATSGRSIVVDAAGLVDANAVKVGPTGAGTAQTSGDIMADTNDIQARLPAALVGGRIAAIAEVVSDKTGYALAAAEYTALVNLLWDELTAEARTAGSYGQKLKDLVLSAGRVDVGLWLGSAPNALVAGDVPANVRAFLAGAITAAAFAVNSLDATALATDFGQEIADRLLERAIQGGTDTGRKVKSAFRRIRNKNSIAAGVLTVTEEDDATTDHTAAVVTTPGDPVSSVDPT